MHLGRWICAWALLAAVGCDDGSGGGSGDAGTDGSMDMQVGPDAAEGCATGTEDCRCLMDETCRVQGLECVEGICRNALAECNPAIERCPPANPQCYSPCRGDLTTADGAVRRCQPNGLLAGCLSGQSCVLGSCVPDNAQKQAGLPPGLCAVESDCPAFQTCIRGRCFSDCEEDADCESECPRDPACVDECGDDEGCIGDCDDDPDCSNVQPVCHLQVCRQLCGERAPCEANGQVCNDGICLPLVEPGAPVDLPEGAGFQVEPNVISFTASTPRGSFVVRNTGSVPLSFTIERTRQRTVSLDGVEQVITNDVDIMTDAPLLWLAVNGVDRDFAPIIIEAGAEAEVELSNARTEEFSRWSGELRIRTTGAEETVELNYTGDVAGRWVGTAYAFGSFPDGGDALDAWSADPSGSADDVPNAFVQAWARYRNGDPQVGSTQMAAIIDATLTGSWAFPRVRELCAEMESAEGGVPPICAPFTGNGANPVLLYTSGGPDRIPSGVIEMDFALHLEAGDDCDDDTCFSGRLDSDTALQYGGNPAVELTFDGDPLDCARTDALGCAQFINRLDAEIVVAGRQPGVDCPAPVTLPWLVPGFWSPSAQSDDWSECRGDGAPLAQANPIANGSPRVRRLSLVDGMMIEQNVMFLLLKETVDPFHGGAEALPSYLYVVLERSRRDPSDVDTTAVNPAIEGAVDRAIACDPSVVNTVLGQNAVPTANAAEAGNLVRALIDGRTAVSEAIDAADVHYICIWNEDDIVLGQQEIDVRRGETVTVEVASQRTVRREVLGAGADGQRPCFPGAEVIYFTYDGDSDPAGWDCNDAVPETCLETLRIESQQDNTIRLSASARSWLERDINDAPVANPVGANTTYDLLVRCTDGSAGCDANRFDLKAGKSFHVADGTNFYNPLVEEVARAFRYKTSFTARTGAQLGFAPTICREGAEGASYCYSPNGIRAIRQRVDCAVAIMDGVQSGDVALGAVDADLLKRFLTQNFSALDADETDSPILQFGFERLYAELLIMLGDDAYTASFASRFDLSQQARRAFPGTLFEGEDGVNLSGAVGFEMYSLHQAAQYYELVLDRFALLSRPMWAVIGNADVSYIGRDTVTTWLERVILASTQLSATSAEIALRYRALNQQGLARRVLTRAYTRAYQESLIIGAFMERLTEVIAAEDQPQVRASLADAARRYRVALLEMRTAWLGVNATTDVFGTPPNFIPFPALDEDAVNGFEVMFERAQNRMELATEDEIAAIASRRAFDSDAQSFQSELVQLSRSYEERLGEICGTFIGDNGRVWPAIPRYAYLSRDLEGVDDPCGFVGNGAFWRAGADLQTMELELERVRQEAQNLLADKVDAEEQVRVQCVLIDEDVATFLAAQGAVIGLATAVDRMGAAITQLDKVHDVVDGFTGRVNDLAEEKKPWSLAFKAGQNIAYLASAGVNLIATSILEAAITVNQSEIRALEALYEAGRIGRECDYLNADLAFTLRDIHRDVVLTELDILNALWNVDVAFSDIQALSNERNRLETEWQESEQLLVDVGAAQNDPNVRIYKNDAIINADRSFERAVRSAWQATRIFEYYTGTTYPEREQLFLVRMVTAGEFNLRRYLQDLEDTFLDFEQQFGNPDTRVLALSLRDDIVKVPYYSSADNRVLSSQARVDLMRQALQNPRNLNESGALSFDFTTSFAALSPLTANHKILFIEVEIFGRNIGDDVGRLYLRQIGTGITSGTDGARRFFTLPPRTAVMNPFFNGNRAFGQDSDGAITGPTRSIYRSYRFRERPLVQSNWQLVLDQRNEAANRDINLAGLDDIIVYVYYTDFTQD